MVEPKPAAKLLLVEHGRTRTDSCRTRKKKKRGTLEPWRLTLTRVREKASDTKKETQSKYYKILESTRTSPHVGQAKATRPCADIGVICKGAADRKNCPKTPWKSTPQINKRPRYLRCRHTPPPAINPNANAMQHNATPRHATPRHATPHQAGQTVQLAPGR